MTKVPDGVGGEQRTADPQKDGERCERRHLRDEPFGVRSLRDLQKADHEKRSAVGADARLEAGRCRFRLVSYEERDDDGQLEQECGRQKMPTAGILLNVTDDPDGEHEEPNLIRNA